MGFFCGNREYVGAVLVDSPAVRIWLLILTGSAPKWKASCLALFVFVHSEMLVQMELAYR